MALDRIDAVAIVGFAGIAAVSPRLEGILLAAAVGGFALSLSSWRLYGGRPWEALAWLSWVGAAVALVALPGGAASAVGFFGLLLAGLGLLFASRLEWLPDIWRAPADGTGDESADG